MKEPFWLQINILIATHKEIIAEHGGLQGIRDINLLESSCAAPHHFYHYSNPKPTFADLAARYAYSISRNHPFKDGNKRMAALSSEIFLELNGLTLNATDEDAFFIFKELAAGSLTEAELVSWLKQNISKN